MGSRVLFIRRFLQKLSPHPRLLHCSRLPPPLPSPRRVPILASESRANWCSNARALSYGSVNLVVSEEGKPRFETHEIDQPKKEKYRTKKRLKLQRKREKRKRKEANKKDPRNIAPKGKKKKDRFPSAEARIKYKIEKAKIKEGLLVEKLKRYEVPQLQGPEVKPENLTGEERFFLKKMSQKKSNYVQIGRRGIFGGVVLNMHLHWKKHETVKVICKPCKPGQVHEYAKDIARLSGGIPVQIIGNDTIIFYRGKNYVQPEVMSPIDTLSKKKALEKSKYEQSLETVRRFIAIAEKELELYYRHVALYGDPNTRNADMVYGDGRKSPKRFNKEVSALANDESVCSTGKDVLGGINNEEILSSSGDDLDIDLSDDESVGDSDDREFTEIETDSEDEVSSTKINSENAISIMQGVPISFIEK